MADVGHFFSGDLQVSATGDLLAVDSLMESQQRVLRRLLTNQPDYLWQPSYGAGLPARIGSPYDENETAALIRSQMFMEQSVVQNPAPVITSSELPNGIAVAISYLEADSGQSATLSFDVTP